MRRSRAIRSRGSKRRRDAVQTRIRGGCSGGGWPRPSGRASLRWSAIVSEAIGNGCEIVADMAGKQTDPQAAMKTHLSQSTGAGAFDGQHGISLAISSIVDANAAASGDISSVIACMRGMGGRRRHDRPGNRSQRKARDHQDREQPSYRKVRFHRSKFSQMGGDGKLFISAYHELNRPLLIGIKLPGAAKPGLKRAVLRSPDRVLPD